MHPAVDSALLAGLAALDNDALHRDLIPSGALQSLRVRRTDLLAALTPAPRPVILKQLASLRGMSSRAIGSDDEAMALASQDAEDLADVSGWALEAAARAFRRGEIGDGKWRPTAGELRKEARRRESEPRAELFRISRLLDSPALEKPKPVFIDREKFETLKDGLAKLGQAGGA